MYSNKVCVYKKIYENIDEVKYLLNNYEYALIYMISEVILKKINHNDDYLNSIDWNQVLEARFFDKNGEVHIFNRENSLNALKIEENTEKVTKNGVKEDYLFFDVSSNLENKFKAVGNKVLIRQYCKYDDDGQLIVELTRLLNIEGGVENGK